MRPPARLAPALLLSLLAILGGAGAAAPQSDEAIGRLLSEGAELEKQGDLDGALEKYALLSEQFPESPTAAEALLRQVRGNLALDRPEAAEAAAQTLLDAHPLLPQAGAARTVLGALQAAAAADAEELDEARETLENAILLFPRASHGSQPWRAEAAVRGARVALRQGRDVDAARDLVDVIDLEPRSRWAAAARLELAALLQDQGDWRQAGALLQEVVDGAGETDEGRTLAALARGRLGLVHRLGLRPESGQERWQSARLVGAAPDKPETVAARADGQVAVVGARGAAVVLDVDGRVVTSLTGNEARRVSWKDEELLVATLESVATYPGRRELRFASPPSEKKTHVKPLVAVEPAPFERWVVLADKPPRVLLYEPGRRLHEQLAGGRGEEPVDLASDRRGRLLVLDGKARSVTRFAAGESRGERLVAGSWDRAEALAVDAAGNIYVLDRDRGRIEVFDRQGGPLTGLGPALPGGLELERPADLTVDLSGRIWVADPRLGLVVLE